jgi:hypothetical protein
MKTLKHEFRADGDDEPYEYVFEWLAEGEPVYSQTGLGGVPSSATTKLGSAD